MEKNTEVQDTNNQGNSEIVTEQKTTETVATDTETKEGATSTTGVTEPEKTFNDPNMQKEWTKKTQELAESRKQWESEKSEWEKQKSDTERKLKILDKIDQDKELVDHIYKKWGINKKSDEVSDDDYSAAVLDPSKMKELVRKEAARMVAPLNQNVTAMKRESEILNFANAAGNEDFWKLDDKGLIQPKLNLLSQQYPSKSTEELLSIAYKDAKQLYSSITAEIRAEEEKRINGMIEEKKQGTIDKGGKSQTFVPQSSKGKSITEIGMEILKTKG